MRVDAWASGPGVISRRPTSEPMSWPAEKLGPAPVRITTRTRSSASAAANAAPFEEPFVADAPVGVVVADRHHDPAIVHLVLGPAVDAAGRGRRAGAVRVVRAEVDPVATDEVDGAVEPPHLRGDEAAQHVAP